MDDDLSFAGRAPVCELGPSELEARHRDVLLRYAELLASCATVRLTGTRAARDLYELHVRDCLASVPFLPASGRAIDVGSGGGLPGVPWAICRPELEVVLLDSVGKKCRALEEIVGALGLSNVEIVCGRSEDVAKARRETFDLACARAVASAGATAELLSPLVRPGGTLLTFKGPKLEGELAEVGARWGRLGLRAPLIVPYDMTGEGSSRCLVLWEKRAPCPRAWPRRPGMASTKGWWL